MQSKALDPEDGQTFNQPFPEDVIQCLSMRCSLWAWILGNHPGTVQAQAFFKGLTASYWGVSEGAIQLALYEEIKAQLDEPSKLQLFCVAGLCKLAAAAATYPHEVVRTRMRDQRTPKDGSPALYRGMFQSIATIYKAEGAAGLYGGMPAHLLKTVPNAAIMYVVVEMAVES